MSWLSSLLDPSFVIFRVSEVRITQGDAKLHSVSVSLATSSQRFSSKYHSPQPVDPVSHRCKVSWQDSEVKVSAENAAFETISVAISNRKRRLRTVIGTTAFNLLTLDPPTSGDEPFKRTLQVETALLPSLNMKIDIVVELQNPGLDSWRSITHGGRSRQNSFFSTRSNTNHQDPDLSPKPVLVPPHQIDPNSRSGTENDSDTNNGTVSSAKSQFPNTPNSSTINIVPPTPASQPTPPTPPPPAADADANAVDSSQASRQASLLDPSPQKSPQLLSDTASISSAESSSTSIGMIKDGAHKPKTGAFGFDLNSDAVGVVFLEIVSIANLPRFRTLTGISFDMDPFVILSFGRRVYKTPHRRHTVNPTFNCKVAFDVGKSETNFDMVFTVWDQDKITLNDKVAEARLPVAKVINNQAPRRDENTGLYDLDNHVPAMRVIPLQLEDGTAEMVTKLYYYPMAAIRQQMWRGIIGLYGNSEVGPSSLSYSEIRALLNSVGSTVGEDTVKKFFTKYNLDPATDRLKEDLIVVELENLVNSLSADRVILFRICPICHKKNPSTKKVSALQHLSVCASRHWAASNAVLLDKKYVSSQQASKRWYTNFFSKFSYGSYQIGAHSANILVQDRISGQINEERMSKSVRLAMRVTYALGPVERKRFQKLLKRYTIKQGKKYSSPSSASSIEPFIKFHGLDMSEVLKPTKEFKTFNEFFFRQLKPGSRPCENSDEPGTAVSAADCRLTVFNSISQATELWIKGKHFSIERLLGDAYPKDAARYTSGGAVAIFRLAPQDYHRVHSPVDGIMGEPKHIDGQYYTVNPMAVRSSLDVFGENVRTVFPIDSPKFGRVMIVMVGAMMVGSCVVTQKPGAEIRRTDELGYFQFGGSTVIALFEKGKMIPDSDLSANSSVKIETLVRVGMSVGHSEDTPEYVRSYDTRHSTISRARTNISGGGSYLPFSLD